MRAFMSEPDGRPAYLDELGVRGDDPPTQAFAAARALDEAERILAEAEPEGDGFYLGGSWPTHGAITGEGKILAESLAVALADWPDRLLLEEVSQ